MDTNQIIALVGATVLSLFVRFANILLMWLAKVLGVDEPSPVNEQLVTRPPDPPAVIASTEPPPDKP